MKHLRRLYPVVVIFFFSFCFFGITQKVSSSDFYCGDQHPKLTKIRNVIIDNYITGYNIVISNGLYVGKIVNIEDSSSKSIIQCGDSPISIFKTEPIYISTSFGTIGKNINKGLEGNVDVYLIPDYFQDEDFIVADCTGYISNSLITDSIHSKIYTLPNSNFDYEKYKIGTISSDGFVNEVDFHEIETTVDRYCAELTDETQYITYHYKISQKGDNYKGMLSDIEKNGYSYYGLHKILFLLKQILFKYKYWWFSGLFIILLYICLLCIGTRIFKMIKNKRNKSSSK